MPAKPPPVNDAAHRQLKQLGATFARLRKAQQVTTTAAAEAAGLSRPTLHRIEKGEPNVSMAAWAATAEALGVRLAVMEPGAPDPAAVVPDLIPLDDYPQLRQLAWQLHGGLDALPPEQALALYERNWRHVDRAALTFKELLLIRALAERFGAGALLV